MSRADSHQAVPADVEAWLLGQPPLAHYVDFVRHVAVEGAGPLARFVDEWRAAGAYYEELEEREAGIANQAECHELDPALGALAEAITVEPRCARLFDTLPTHFGMVQLDRLIVGQKSVTWSFVEELAARLGPSPDAVAVFQFCQPVGGSDAAIETRRVGGRRFTFRSRSRDLRYQEPSLVGDNDVRGVGMVGLSVGFGTNLLNVVRVGKRLFLNNGTHRACALRALGLTHAPAIVQTVTTTDELELAVKASTAARADFYFRSARPPLIKDFFDPRICKRLPARRQVRQIEVQFEVKEFLVDE